MATSLTQQILSDSTRHTLIKYTGLTDSVVANVVLVDASTLSGAMNANNQILGTGTDRKFRYGLGIKRIFGQGQVKSGGNITLQWETNGNVAHIPIVTVGAGSFDYSFDLAGTAGMITCPDPANTTGNIIIATAGVASPDSVTLFISLKKDGADYDQGQINSPADFNWTS